MLADPSDRVRAILDRIAPYVKNDLPEFERRLLVPGAEFRDLVPELDQLRARIKADGLWAPWLSKDLGGMGLSLFEFAHISEALGGSPLGHYAFGCQAPDVGNIELLTEHGTPDQKSRWLEPLARGEIRSTFTMTEPEMPGSNPVLLGATAVLNGDEWVLNGRKWFSTGAEGAAFAIAMMVTDPDHEKMHARASMILVPVGTPGFRLVRNISVMGDVGSDWASHGEVVYENCRVPKENLVGPRGGGFALAQERLGPGRIHHCMRWIGICERAFDLMCRHAATRQIAPFVPLATRQQVQFWIAESRAEINAARLVTLDAAARIDAVGAPAARIEISTIKFFVAGVLQRVLDRALQVHGGLGVTDDTPIAWFFRHERAARIYDGADEVHKASVARYVLAQYGVKTR